MKSFYVSVLEIRGITRTHNKSLPGSVGEQTTTLRLGDERSTARSRRTDLKQCCLEPGCEFIGAHNEICRKRSEKEMLDAGEASDADEKRKGAEGRQNLHATAAQSPRTDNDHDARDFVPVIFVTDTLLSEKPRTDLMNYALAWSVPVPGSQLKKGRERNSEHDAIEYRM